MPSQDSADSTVQLRANIHAQGGIRIPELKARAIFGMQVLNRVAIGTGY